jgi:hypothetical protein
LDTSSPAIPQVVNSTIEPVANQTQPGLWANVFGTEEGKVLRNNIRAERKIQLEGGNGVGPARVPKSAEERRRGGRARDNLVDDLIIESRAPKPPPHSHESRLVVYCIGCDKMVVGRDAQRIRNHGKDCDVLLATFYITRELKYPLRNLQSTFQSYIVESLRLLWNERTQQSWIRCLSPQALI